jgi:hypothetical protein
MRKVSLFLISILLLAVLPGGAQGAQTPDEHWQVPSPTANGQIGVGFDDREDYFSIGALRALVYKKGIPTGPVCSSLADPACEGAEYFAVKASLTPCDLLVKVNCVESLIANLPDGRSEKAEFKNYVSTDASVFWTGNSTLNVPDSKSEMIWNFPTLSHAGGKDFLVNVILDGDFTPKNSPRWSRLVAMVQPVTKVADSSAYRPVAFSNDDMSWMSKEAIEGGNGWAGAQRGGLHKNCATTTDGFCFRREPFPEGTSLSLSIRTNSQVGGWIHGRMKSPNIKIEEIDGYWRTTVGGKPTEVPVVGIWFDNKDFTDEAKIAYKNAGESTWGVASGGVATRYGSTGQYDSVTISRLNSIRSLIKDKASANPEIWSFGTISPQKLASDIAALSGKSSCVSNAKGLTGIVMTNATTYDGSVPVFSEKDQTLNYLVSAPHFAANGEEFLGTYDLVIRSDVAKCIYGFNQTPTSATVSIIRGEAVEKVSTTTLSEKDGWLSLSAYGFTFSSPKISVKLIAPTVAPAASPVVAPSLKPAPAKVATQKSIVCAQGKNKKKLTGTNPKCPKGYKLVK